MSRHSLVFWNIQRLFGSQGSPIEHALFGGEAIAADTTEKIRVISAVLNAIAAKHGPPLLVGFAEIENVGLCQKIADGVSSCPMKAAELLQDDETGFALDGLNIGLLLDTELVQRVDKLRSHVIDRKFITRDILECDFTLKGDQKMSVLVNHWPSRMVSEAAGQRISAALYLKDLINSKTRFTLLEMWDSENRALSIPDEEAITKRALNPVAVMGDFNDEMFDESIELFGSTNSKKIVMGSENPTGSSKKKQFQSYMKKKPSLYNPFWELIGNQGSYYRSPRWRYYDQIMISKGLLDDSFPPTYQDKSVKIFNEKSIPLEDGTFYQITNRNGKPIPFDPIKNRGCSDHFPVVISVEF